MKLTINEIKVLPLTNRDEIKWDDDLPGFGLRIKPNGVMSFLVQYRNASGRSRRLTLGRYGLLTPDEARRLAKQRLADAIRGDDPVEARLEQRKAMTIKKLCEQYLAATEKGLILGKKEQPKKLSTLYSDRGRINRHILPLLGNMKVRDLTSPDIIRFMRDVASGKTATDERTKKRGRAIVKGGSGTAARTVGLLGGILSYAVSEGIIVANPVRGVKRPKGKSRKIRLTDEQYGILGDSLELALQDGYNRQGILAIKLIALTGCRKGEIENLCWNEVDFERKCLRLTDSKEGASIRPLGKSALALLAAIPKNGKYVFQEADKWRPYRGLPKLWLKIRDASALPSNLTMHGLRHSFASVAGDAGYAEPTIAALLGHGMHSNTGRYIHPLDDVLLSAADRVVERIAVAMQTISHRDDRESHSMHCVRNTGCG